MRPLARPLGPLGAAVGAAAAQPPPPPPAPLCRPHPSARGKQRGPARRVTCRRRRAPIGRPGGGGRGAGAPRQRGGGGGRGGSSPHLAPRSPRPPGLPAPFRACGVYSCVCCAVVPVTCLPSRLLLLTCLSCSLTPLGVRRGTAPRCPQPHSPTAPAATPCLLLPPLPAPHSPTPPHQPHLPIHSCHGSPSRSPFPLSSTSSLRPSPAPDPTGTYLQACLSSRGREAKHQPSLAARPFAIRLSCRYNSQPRR